MQLAADWIHSYTPEFFEKDLGMEFKGPGLYCTDHDTLIVVPNPPETDVTAETLWAVEQPEGTIYTVHCYNTVFNDTVLAHLTSIPTRS